MTGSLVDGDMQVSFTAWQHEGIKLQTGGLLIRGSMALDFLWDGFLMRGSAAVYLQLPFQCTVYRPVDLLWNGL
jgi:hypothetical protein